MGKHLLHKCEVDRWHVITAADHMAINKNIQTRFPENTKNTKMAQINFGLILLKWIGLPIAFLAWIENLTNDKGWLTTIFAIPALIAYASYMWQKRQLTKEEARKERLKNDETEWDLNQKKYHH